MQKLTIYYDGQCPLCQAEIEFLKMIIQNQNTKQDKKER